jgi:hypothetical protein
MSVTSMSCTGNTGINSREEEIEGGSWWQCSKAKRRRKGSEGSFEIYSSELIIDFHDMTRKKNYRTQQLYNADGQTAMT